jgi:hypothetical protein
MWFWYLLAWVAAGFTAYYCRWMGRAIWSVILIAAQFVAVSVELGKYPKVPNLDAAVEGELLTAFTWAAAVTGGIALGGGWLRDALTAHQIEAEREHLAERSNEVWLRWLDVALSTLAVPWVVSRWSALSWEQKLVWIEERRDRLNNLPAVLGPNQREWDRYQLVEYLAHLDAQ